jgi:hypothetical protein
MADKDVPVTPEEIKSRIVERVIGELGTSAIRPLAYGKGTDLYSKSLPGDGYTKGDSGYTKGKVPIEDTPQN